MACARWTALHLLRTPWLWIAAVLGAGLWGLAATLGPVGIASDPTLEGQVHLQLTALGMLVGVSLSVELLSRGDWIFARSPYPRRARAQAAALGSGIALGWLAVASFPLLSGSPLEPAALLAASTWTGLHLLTLALVALQVPLGSLARAGSLVAASTVAPALLQGSKPGGDLLARLLDPCRHLEAVAGGAGPQLGASLGPILAWLLVAILLGAPSLPNRPGPPHALRHPR